MLGPISLFSSFTEGELGLIAGHGATRNYPKGAVVINEGEEGDSFFLIRSGRVKVYASDENGREVALNTQGPGEYFGELALMDTAPRSASVMTLEPTVLSVVSRSHFERCLAEHPQFMYKMVRPLVQRIRELTRNVKNLALLDVYGRVARTLLDLVVDREGEQVIEEPLTHQGIANMVGASREMVSRIMKGSGTRAVHTETWPPVRHPQEPASWLVGNRPGGSSHGRYSVTGCHRKISLSVRSAFRNLVPVKLGSDALVDEMILS